MFTSEEKSILRFVVNQKLEIAKEISKCTIKEQKKSCIEMEKTLEEILNKIKWGGFFELQIKYLF